MNATARTVVSPSSVAYRVSTRTVGQNFGTCAVVKLGRKVVHEGEVRPLGFVSAALDDAAAWVAKH